MPWRGGGDHRRELEATSVTTHVLDHRVGVNELEPSVEQAFVQGTGIATFRSDP